MITAMQGDYMDGHEFYAFSLPLYKFLSRNRLQHSSSVWRVFRSKLNDQRASIQMIILCCSPYIALDSIWIKKRYRLTKDDLNITPFWSMSQNTYSGHRTLILVTGHLFLSQDTYSSHRTLILVTGHLFLSQDTYSCHRTLILVTGHLF